MAFENISKETKWAICIVVVVVSAFIGWYVGSMYDNEMIGIIVGALIGIAVAWLACWLLKIELFEDIKMTY